MSTTKQKTNKVRCYQKVEGITKTPFLATVLVDMGGHLRIKAKGKEYVVNKGACSYK